MTFLASAAPSHVNPTLAIATALLRRGASVSYLAEDSARERVEAIGARFIRIEEEATPAQQDRLPASARTSLRRAVARREGLLGALRQAPRVLGLARAERSDVIVLDRTTGWHGVASALGRPIVTFVPSFFFAADSPLVQAGVPTGSDLESPRLQQADRELSSLQTELLRDYGITPIDPDRLFTAPADLNVSASFRELQPDGARFSRPGYLYLGPPVADRDEPPLPELDRLPRPLIYAAFGSAEPTDPRLLKLLLDAFRGQSWGVVAAGKRPRSLPAWCLVRPRVPQLQVLSQANVFVTHAGINSILEAINFRVPMILFPRTREQRFVADQVVRLGLGVLRSRADVTAGDLRVDAENLIRSSTVHQRLERARECALAADGAKAAADAILGLARSV
ncbi:MAG: glycosyltransferase [Gaiellaceae bacterium]